MSVRRKLLLILTVVAALPLAIATVSILSVHQSALEQRVVELQHYVARDGASRAQAYFDRLSRSLARFGGASFQWDELSETERAGALWLIFDELEDAVDVSLVDAANNSVLASAHAGAGDSPPLSDGGKHLAKPQLPHQQAHALGIHAPRLSADAHLAIGQPFVVEGLTAPLVVTSSSLASPARATWVLRVTLSLGPLCREMRELANGAVRRDLVDGAQRLLCGSAHGLPSADAALVRALVENVDTLRYRQGDDERLAAVAPMDLGWHVIAEQSTGHAFAASDRIRLLTLFFLLATVVVALVAGTQLAHIIIAPLQQLSDAATQFAAGNFAHRVGLRGNDELRDVANAFDHMGAEIEVRDREIRAWNDELQSRVEERTNELEAAHARLEQTQRVAAMTRLGSGLASKINNPLTSVLGLLQLLHRRSATRPNDPHTSLLAHASREALRIRSLMKQLLALSHRLRETDLSEVGLFGLLESTLKLVERDLKARRVVVLRDPPSHDFVVRAAVTQLQQGLLQVITHGLETTAPGGAIRVVLGREGSMATLAVTSQGTMSAGQLESIAEPFQGHRDDAMSIGLATAYRILEEHDGDMHVASSTDLGTCITLRVPLAAERLVEETPCAAA